MLWQQARHNWRALHRKGIPERWGDRPWAQWLVIETGSLEGYLLSD